MILPIVAFGSPILRKKCSEVSQDFQELDSLLDRVMNAIDRLSQKVDRLFEERS